MEVIESLGVGDNLLTEIHLESRHLSAEQLRDLPAPPNGQVAAFQGSVDSARDGADVFGRVHQ